MLKMKALSIFLLLTAIISAIGCRKAGLWLIKEDHPQTADAIVILTGSIADRVLQAADIYKSGYAGKILIVNESMGAYKELEKRGFSVISKTSQTKDALVFFNVPRDSIIILPGDAESTMSEVMIIRNYISLNNNIDTILLITSSPHTRRASMIFNKAFSEMETPVTVLSIPSVYNKFNADKWWRCKEDIQIVFLEYMKLMNFLLFEKNKL
jgi:uncharacterized SAM-binding protein YcdF (DUF218 family)